MDWGWWDPPVLPAEYDVYCCIVLALCLYLAAQEGVEPQLYADNLTCVSRYPYVLLRA